MKLSRSIYIVLFAAATVLVAFTFSSVAYAQKPMAPDGPWYSGYLCCNVRSYGRTISDINYDEGGTTVVPLGTPARVLGYELHWFNAEIGGRRMIFKNGYNRDIGTVALVQRYIVADNPTIKLATYPDNIREAVAAGKVSAGMTREQVLMAIGYPVSTENPTLDAQVWRFWLDSWTEFDIHFDKTGRVEKVTAEPETQARVMMN